MRLFAVTEAGDFLEYQEEIFREEYREETVESWLASNPDCISEEDSLLIIGRQVSTNLRTAIDLLAVDSEGNAAVIELKRDRTPRETLAQALEYASFIEQLSYEQLNELFQEYTGEEGTSLAEAHRMHFGLSEDEAVSFNKDQRIIIVGSEISPPIRQTCAFLRKQGIRVTCLEFVYFQGSKGEELVSIDVAVGRETERIGKVTTEALPRTTRDEFLASCDEAGKGVFEPILELADSEGLPIHWGSRGFTVNADVGSATHVSLCLSFPKATTTGQAAQSLRIWFREIDKKLLGVEDLISEFRREFIRTELFEPSGSYDDVKYLIDSPPGEEKVSRVVELVHGLATEVKKAAERQEV